jgi:twitching motility protein PilT
MHTVDAAETIGRMVEFFPAVKQPMIRSIMAGVLRGVISQRLLPRINGGRVAAVEVMVTNNRIADLIREGESESIPDAIAEGQFFNMQSFTHALIEHVLSGEVDQEVAANAATSRHDFLVELERSMKQKAAEERQSGKNDSDAAPEPEQVPAEPTPEPEFPALRLAGPGG